MSTDETAERLQPDEVRQQPLASEDAPEASLSAQTLFAVVNANGTLARGHGAVSARSLGVGNYEVIFNQNITNAAYNATIGLAARAGVSPPGQISVVGRAGTTNGVFIETTNSSGTRINLGFHLTVHF